MRYSFVTVFFTPEVLLLELQARSLALYVPEALVEEIIVVNNGRALTVEEERRVRLAYGRHASVLTIKSALNLVSLPPTSGWDSQQVLKLVISRFVRSSLYLVLDAKTHFISELEPSFLVSPDGRPRANIIDYSANPQRYALERAARFLGVSDRLDLTASIDSITPFVFVRDLVTSMMAGVASISGRSFERTFVDEGLSEFTLYSAWISRDGGRQALEGTYDFHQNFPPIVWGDYTSFEKVNLVLEKAAASGNPCLSTHRRAFPRLSEPSRQALAAFWVARRLLDSEPIALQFIDKVAEAVTASESLERTERRRLKGRYLVRRLVSRARMVVASFWGRRR